MPFDVLGPIPSLGHFFPEGCGRAKKNSKLPIDARMLGVPGKKTMLLP